MKEDHNCDCLIVGAGLAGASAADGIREVDPDRAITLMGDESHLPYDRPPLTKKLWTGQKKVDDLFLHNQAYYDRNGIAVVSNRRIVALDVNRKTARDNRGETWSFNKLLLATGGLTRPLRIPGGNLRELCYYRNLDDYTRIRQAASPGTSAVVIGGGFIGSELAASLCACQVNVTMLYPDAHLGARVFPESLGLAMEGLFESRGIRILKGRKPASFERAGSRISIRTTWNETLEADLVIAGVGLLPAVELASDAGLSVSDGIRVDCYLQTSHPDIYAAGDNARFPYRVLGPPVRLEHWDNALNQGRQAGRNMAGAYEAYSYMPYFFSDLFEFGYEAVGEINPKLDIFADWQKENEKGVLYYLKDGKVRGAMMCNVWDKVPEARDLIRQERAPPALKRQGALA